MAALDVQPTFERPTDSVGDRRLMAELCPIRSSPAKHSNGSDPHCFIERSLDIRNQIGWVFQTDRETQMTVYPEHIRIALRSPAPCLADVHDQGFVVAKRDRLESLFLIHTTFG